MVKKYLLPSEVFRALVDKILSVLGPKYDLVYFMFKKSMDCGLITWGTTNIMFYPKSGLILAGFKRGDDLEVGEKVRHQITLFLGINVNDEMQTIEGDLLLIWDKNCRFYREKVSPKLDIPKMRLDTEYKVKTMQPYLEFFEKIVTDYVENGRFKDYILGV